MNSQPPPAADANESPIPADVPRLLHHVAALVEAGVPVNLDLAGSPTSVADQVRRVARQIGEGVPADLVPEISPRLTEIVEQCQTSRFDGQVLPSLSRSIASSDGGRASRTIAYQALGLVALAAGLFLLHCRYVIPRIGDIHRAVIEGTPPMAVQVMEHMGRFAVAYGLLFALIAWLIVRSIRRSFRGGFLNQTGHLNQTGFLNQTGQPSPRRIQGDVNSERLSRWMRRRASVRQGAWRMAWSLITLVGISGVATLLYGLALFGPMSHMLGEISRSWGTGP